MKQLQEDLWQSTLHSSGILNTHAYFLRRPEGNALFYNTGDDADLDEIEELGGLRFQLLSHRDEAAPSLRRISERFGSQLCCSALEAPTIRGAAPPDVLFGPGERRLDDIEIIQTPGHTEGSLSFFYRSPHGKRTSSQATRSSYGTASGQPSSSPTRAAATRRWPTVSSGCETSAPISS